MQQVYIQTPKEIRNKKQSGVCDVSIQVVYFSQGFIASSTNC